MLGNLVGMDRFGNKYYRLDDEDAYHCQTRYVEYADKGSSGMKGSKSLQNLLASEHSKKLKVPDTLHVANERDEPKDDILVVNENESLYHKGKNTTYDAMDVGHSEYNSIPSHKNGLSKSISAKSILFPHSKQSNQLQRNGKPSNTATMNQIDTYYAAADDNDNAYDVNAHDDNTHDANAYAANAHDNNGYDSDSYITNADDANAYDAMHIARRPNVLQAGQRLSPLPNQSANHLSNISQSSINTAFPKTNRHLKHCQHQQQLLLNKPKSLNIYYHLGDDDYVSIEASNSLTSVCSSSNDTS